MKPLPHPKDLLASGCHKAPSLPLTICMAFVFLWQVLLPGGACAGISQEKSLLDHPALPTRTQDLLSIHAPPIEGGSETEDEEALDLAGEIRSMGTGESAAESHPLTVSALPAIQGALY